MGSRNIECRKFSPNIFNKSKCTHCFRQREEHSAAALECNRRRPSFLIPRGTRSVLGCLSVLDSPSQKAYSAATTMCNWDVRSRNLTIGSRPAIVTHTYAGERLEWARPSMQDGRAFLNAKGSRSRRLRHIPADARHWAATY
uniref:Uncharacterized protein n=1 Tax=Anopheles atroparvus TaxID=41427 RepID=A0A182JJD0_ANOAO